MACPTQVNYTTTTVPCYMAACLTSLMGQARKYTCIATNPYQQYQGCTIAQFTPEQQQAFQETQNLSAAPQLQCASALAGSAGQAALNTQYSYNPYAAQQGLAINPNTGMNNISSYMNPYLQSSLAPQLQLMQQQQAAQQQTNQASAVRCGAFGGTRCAVLTGAQNQANQLAQNTLVGNAYNQAYKCAQSAFAAQQGACQNAANLNAQQSQFGANLGLQGLNAANTSASNLNQIAQNQYGQNTGIIGLQSQVGAQQQQQAQNVLNQQYQCFLNYKNYPQQQLSFQSNILHGLPMTNTTSATYQAPPSILSQVAGAGLTGATLYNATKCCKRAGGGHIKEKHRYNGLADIALAKMGSK